MKIKFIPQEIEIETDSQKSIMSLAHENGVYIKSICNGMPSCAECRVKVVEGEDNILPPTKSELNLIGSGYFIDRRRLACQMYCFGDLVIDLSEQIEKEKISTKKRPQGNLKKESVEESLAVIGNLMDQDKSLVQEEIKKVSDSLDELDHFDGVLLMDEKKTGSSETDSEESKNPEWRQSKGHKKNNQQARNKSRRNDGRIKNKFKQQKRNHNRKS